MKAPPLPPHEEERLAAVESTNLLDTVPEKDFNDLVEVAAYLCGTPIAAISLIDRDRQWFKARHGFEPAETSREISFCGHAILDPGRLLEVPDALDDERFHDNPLVTGSLGLRFYAGVPLVTDDGQALGALCVIDQVPRSLSPAQRSALEALSRQVTAQIKLRQRSSELEMANRELLLARDQAEEASDSRTRLLTSVSHELRTPMNGVLGMSTLLLSTALDAEQRELADTIRTSSEQLLRLLNQLLDFARLEAEANADLDARPLDLVASIDEVVELVSTEAALKSIDLQVVIDPSLPHRVSGDAGRLRQVLINLVGNAIKFTDEGEVTIEVGPHDRPDHVLVSITDSGPGLPADRIAGLFRPFYRIAETARQAPGTGLGLAICRRLVDLMGGHVWADNVPGRGARFSFAVPAPRAAAPPPPLAGMSARVVSASAPVRRALRSRLSWWGADAAAFPVELAPAGGDALDLLLLDGDAPATPARLVVRLLGPDAQASGDGEIALPRPARWRRLLRRIEQLGAPESVALADPPGQGFDGELAQRLPLKILLAEDNVINQRVVCKMLERFGYRLRIVSDGRQAVEALSDEPFDVVLMDVHMPVLGGLEATRQLRRLGSRAYVVAMTASAFDSDREACLAAGMDDYITKPLLVPELVQALRRASAQRRRSN